MAPPKPPLPAVAFAEDELYAVIVGLVLLQRRTAFDDFDDAGDGYAETAEAALDRIAAALPSAPLGPAPRARKSDGPHHAAIRAAIHGRTKLQLAYIDRKRAESRRMIWPVAFDDFGAGETVTAWCESRNDFRNFRLDRIVTLEATDQPIPIHPRILLARLRMAEEDF